VWPQRLRRPSDIDGSQKVNSSMDGRFFIAIDSRLVSASRYRCADDAQPLNSRMTAEYCGALSASIFDTSGVCHQAATACAEMGSLNDWMHGNGDD
jgi:hypothetical protein